MGFSCGIVGLPNVGKSTLFNALTATQAAESANYPFCTIEPNVGRVGVPDPRLTKLAELAGSKKVIPTQLEFQDIAGLVKGASKGEGLGNQFLGHIREVDAIVHVVRCFEDSNITHVNNTIDPVNDAEVVETELMLADMESLERQLISADKRARSGDKDAKARVEIIQEVLAHLREGNPVRSLEMDEEKQAAVRTLNMITAKPVLYVCNVGEEDVQSGNEHTKAVEVKAEAEGARMVLISAGIEAEIAQLSDPAEKSDFLESLGLEETGLTLIIREGYGLLGLQTFFTVGPKEARAWTVKMGSKAPQAAGEIHTDFERGYICAETIAYDDYIAHGTESAVKEAGKMRIEGRDYIVKDADIFHFRFNV